MALVFSGGTLVDTTFSLGTSLKKKKLYDELRSALNSAGWTITDTLPSQTLNMNNTGNRVNNETVVVLGKTYTFKTAINNANDGEVLIGANGVASATNMIAAMNLTAGAGTTYSSATTAGDGTVTDSTLSGGTGDTLVWTATDYADAGGAVTETCANWAWDSATLSVASFEAQTAETPDYLWSKMKYNYNGETPTSHYLLDRSGGNQQELSDDSHYDYTDNRQIRILAHKYGFWSFTPGGKGDYQILAVHQPSIPEPMRCKKVTGATNASPIEITTNVAHGYSTGQQVLIAYVEGNTAANGTHTITSTGSTTFTLDGSTGSGTFSGSDGISMCASSGYKEVGEFSFGYGPSVSGGLENFRDTMDMTDIGPLFFNTTAFAAADCVMQPSQSRIHLLNTTTPAWWNDANLLEAPIIAVSVDLGVTYNYAGQLYNTAYLRQSIPMDQAVTDASGNNWLTLTDSYTEGTFVALVS
jgi:hypothetical protein